MVSTQSCLLWRKAPCLKDGLCFLSKFLFKNPWTVIPLCFLWRQPVLSYLQIFLLSDGKDRWLPLPQLRVVLCHMLPIFLQITFPFASSTWERKDRAGRRGELHLQVLLSARQNHHLHISRAGQLKHKHYSLSPFFGAAHGARGPLYVKMQWKGQGTLINFTWHSHLLWTCLTFTQPRLVTSPLKHPGWNSHLMSVSRLPPSPHPTPPTPLLFFS